MYSDHVNELYLKFLKLVLCEFERLNLLFQHDNVEFSKLLAEHKVFTISMLKRVVIPDYANIRADMNFQSILLPLQSVDFGYEFSNMLPIACRMWQWLYLRDRIM